MGVETGEEAVSFDDAFAAALKDLPAATPPADDRTLEAAADAEAAAAAAPAAVAPPVVETPPAAVVPPVVEAPPAAVTPPAAVVPPVVEAPPAAVTPPADPAYVPPVFAYTEEETAALAEIEKDWPAIAAANRAAERKRQFDEEQRLVTAVANTLGYVEKEFVEPMNTKLTPLLERMSTQAQVEHHTAVHAAHADFNEVVDQIPDWIKTQPSYLQGAMQRVYDSGNSVELNELVSQFKTANNITTPAVVVGAPPAAPAAVTPAPARAAAAATAPVRTSATAVIPSAADPRKDDFDGAFAEATKSDTGKRR